MDLQDRLDIIRSECQKFAQNSEHDLEDLEIESWLASRAIEDGALIRICARHTCIDLFRKQKCRREHERAFSLIHSEDIEPPQDTTSKLDLNALMNEALTLGILTTSDQELIWRYYYCSETYRDIGKTQCIAPSTVKNLLAAAEAKLRMMSESRKKGE